MNEGPGLGQRLRERRPGFALAIAALCALEFTCAVLALILTWGADASGSEIKSSIEGLLPWFMFVPIVLQLGFLLVSSTMLEGLYILTNFVVAAFIVGVHYLTFLKYEGGFEPGFYLVFLGAGLAVAAGVACLVERWVLPGAVGPGAVPFEKPGGPD